jgi:hypothetical protein
MPTFNDANHYASILFKGESYSDPSIKYPKVDKLTFVRDFFGTPYTTIATKDEGDEQGEMAADIEALLNSGYRCVDAPKPITMLDRIAGTPQIKKVQATL